MKAYEQANGIESSVRGFIMHIIYESPDEEKPEWPEKLKSYNTDSFPEAYLMDKFDIEKP